jgi:DNA polymerase
VVATTHPSAILRSRNREEDYAAFVGDLLVVKDALAG